jgi:hypothetical protein
MPGGELLLSRSVWHATTIPHLLAQPIDSCLHPTPACPSPPPPDCPSHLPASQPAHTAPCCRVLDRLRQLHGRLEQARRADSDAFQLEQALSGCRRLTAFVEWALRSQVGVQTAAAADGAPAVLVKPACPSPHHKTRPRSQKQPPITVTVRLPADSHALSSPLPLLQAMPVGCPEALTPARLLHELLPESGCE